MTWKRRSLLGLLGCGTVALSLAITRLRATSQFPQIPSDIPSDTFPPESPATISDSAGNQTEVILERHSTPEIPLVIYYPTGMTVQDTRSYPLFQLPQDFDLPYEGQQPSNREEAEALMEAVENYEGDFHQNVGPEFIEACFIDIPEDRTSSQTGGIVRFLFPVEPMNIAELKRPLLDGSSAIQSMTQRFPNTVILGEHTGSDQIPYAWAKELYVVSSNIFEDNFPGLVRYAQYLVGEINGSAFIVSVAVSGLDDSVLADTYQPVLPIETSWERFFPTANLILSNIRKPVD